MRCVSGLLARDARGSQPHVLDTGRAWANQIQQIDVKVG